MPRSTRQKKLIVEELMRTREHPTASALHQAVRRRLPTVSLGTVYRVLGKLEADRAVLRLSSGGMPARFDADTSPHNHIRCIRCGRVDDIPAAPGEAVAELCPDTAGYELTGARLELEGICPSCGRTR